MAHFAKMDSNNNVIEIVVLDNKETADENGMEVEQIGIEFLEDLFGYSLWKQTSYNGNFRKNYAGIGMKYDPEADGFHEVIGEFPSWRLDKDTFRWEPPIPKPDFIDENTHHDWSELTQEWVVVKTKDGKILE